MEITHLIVMCEVMGCFGVKRLFNVVCQEESEARGERGKTTGGNIVVCQNLNILLCNCNVFITKVALQYIDYIHN